MIAFVDKYLIWHRTSAVRSLPLLTITIKRVGRVGRQAALRAGEAGSCANPMSLAEEPVDLDDLFGSNDDSFGEPVGLRPFRFYRRTKNMNAMFVYALAVSGVHPGHIGGTGLHRQAPEESAAAMAAAVQR